MRWDQFSRKPLDIGHVSSGVFVLFVFFCLRWSVLVFVAAVVCVGLCFSSIYSFVCSTCACVDAGLRFVALSYLSCKLPQIWLVGSCPQAVCAHVLLQKATTSSEKYFLSTCHSKTTSVIHVSVVPLNWTQLANKAQKRRHLADTPCSLHCTTEANHGRKMIQNG